jgi:hypothetical protein
MSKSGGILWKRALTEFLVIFIGITLSLMADDWRQSQEEKRRERSALTEMMADLQTDSLDLETMLRSARRWDAAAVWVLRNVDRRDVPEDSVRAGLRPFFFTALYQPIRSAYTGLRSSGQLWLIRDESIRRLVVDYYEVSQPYMLQFTEGAEPSYHLPFLEASRELVVWKVDSTATSMRDESGRLEPRRPWGEIAGDPDFLSTATSLGMFGATFALRIPPVLEKNGALRNSIGEYLR